MATEFAGNGWSHLLLLGLCTAAGLVLFVGLHARSSAEPLSIGSTVTVGRTELLWSVGAVLALLPALTVCGAYALQRCPPSQLVPNAQYWLHGIPSRRAYSLGVLRDAALALGSTSLVFFETATLLLVGGYSAAWLLACLVGYAAAVCLAASFYLGVFSSRPQLLTHQNALMNYKIET